MASTPITIDAAQNAVDILADQDADSTDSEIRYLAYGARLRTALRAGSRYVAYVRPQYLCLAYALKIDIPGSWRRQVTLARPSVPSSPLG
jgi:hypothetical protein